MMNKCLLLIIAAAWASCQEAPRPGEMRTMDFGAFTLEAPATWKAIKVKGFDSYVGKIAIDHKDTLYFDLGWYSNPLTEHDPSITDSIVGLIENRKGIDPEQFRKNAVAWDTIDGRKAKIVLPKQSGTGTTGVYFDSLWVAGSDVDRFNLCGRNLQPANEQKVLQVIRTLKFRKED